MHRISNKSILVAVFLLIIIISAFFRFYKIADNPPSLNWDEVSHGYNAYSILKSGKDEWGEKLPIIFRAYGDYKLPIYIYLTAISEYLFGLNEFAVRLPSVLSGIITVALTFFLTKEIFLFIKNSKNASSIFKDINIDVMALLAALFVAVEPWSLFLSRPAFEANTALTFFLTGLYLFIRSFYKTKYLPFSIIFFGLSCWTYNSYRIFTPLLLASILIFYKEKVIETYKREKKSVYISFSIFLLLFVPMFVQLLNPNGLARYSKVSIIDNGAVGKILEMRNDSDLNVVLGRVIYNRYTFFIYSFLKNWLSSYSLDFLYLEGGSNYQFSIPSSGLMFVVGLPFLILGLFYLFKNYKNTKIILIWIALAPLASSVTREAPHVLRLITFLPLPMIITSLGIVILFSKSTKISKYLQIGYSVLIVVFTLSYFSGYFANYRHKYSWSWQYGYKEAVTLVRDVYYKYDSIIVTKKYGEPHEFFLFYLKWDPQRYINDPYLISYQKSSWYWVDRFDKFYFVNDWDVPTEEWQNFKVESGGEFSCYQKKCLLVTSPGNSPKTWRFIKSIDFLDGSPAFEIYEN